MFFSNHAISDDQFNDFERSFQHTESSSEQCEEVYWIVYRPLNHLTDRKLHLSEGLYCHISSLGTVQLFAVTDLETVQSKDRNPIKD